jgi:hypothetical protein
MSSISDALLIQDLVEENERLRQGCLSLWRSLFGVRELLSVSLERLSQLTRRCEDQSDQIRRLLGRHDDHARQVVIMPWYPTMEEAASCRQEGMVRADDIRWTVE